LNHTLADELEDSELRREMYGVKPAVESTANVPAAVHEYRMRFTGDGAEYFRIWIVNLLLTLLTLGVYSAWAKVRKTKYFWQNTRLGDAAFDYHGRPLAILRGRIIALGLLAAYTFGFDISATVALVTISVLIAVGPWLFLKAQQFKLRNTSYRGLRFSFESSPAVAYKTLLPWLLVWFASTLATLIFETIGFGVVLIAFFTAVMIPMIHHELKRYQHANATYGDLQFRFTEARDDFYAAYVRALGFLIPAAFLGGTIAGFVAAWLQTGDEPRTMHIVITAGFAGMVVYVCVAPYLAARLQKIVWDNTQLPRMRFRTEIRAMTLFRLVAKNMILTLLTLGLYWPFAAVALARYRVEAFVAASEVPIDEFAGATRTLPGTAAGEGAADLLGLDIGL
jgi:uncharacterized membrane protein YjgN (DUF898 family)